MPVPPPFRLTGARVLTEAGLSAGSVTVAAGRIAGTDGRAVDLSGHLVLPGIVDAWAEGAGDAAAAGITTRVEVQGWSWEGGLHGPAAAEARMAAPPAPGTGGIDRRLALRVETHTTDTTDRLAAALRRHGADLVLFSDRLPETLERLRADLAPGAAAAWMRAEAARECAGGVPRHLCRLAEVMDMLGVRYGSLGDRDAGVREYFRLIGARVCVAPVRAAPARAAEAAGDPVLLAAAEVLAAGAAADLAAAGIGAGLVSGPADGATLPRAALRLAGTLGWPRAWALVSAGPAAVLGLTDRGRIAAGLRADLCILDAATGAVAGTVAAGRLVFATPEVRARFGATGGAAPLAAE